MNVTSILGSGIPLRLPVDSIVAFCSSGEKRKPRGHLGWQETFHCGRDYFVRTACLYHLWRADLKRSVIGESTIKLTESPQLYLTTQSRLILTRGTQRGTFLMHLFEPAILLRLP